MKRRPRRTTPAVLVAVVGLVACAFIAVIAIQMILGRAPWTDYRAVAAALHGAEWNDPIPAIIGGVTALVGLILLLAAVMPGKPTVLPLRGSDTAIDSGASRRSYCNTLRVAASTVDGVSGARLTLRRNTVAAAVNTQRTNTDGLAEAVRAAIEHRIEQITPAARPKIKIKVRAVRSAS
ncbi:hypothetical protein FKR81_02490 [Lentzea tibetensis]|uniref:DUF6286 domain-containing protein n=1 Tax=Lentzea tibetensis TaxID=2591470 RepID=A0A563F119_9PSEU|nr:DUF6286 domain-containing protein [Lentzea tibetensis]TWP53650.1 hypothetical protein FKR81_02490 [Lentzea tibetensis]